MALQSLLGSAALRRVLVHFAARPESRLHFRALERRLGLSRQSLKNALDTLEELGLVRRDRQGQRVVYAATEHPGWSGVREVVRSFASPAEVVGDLLRGVPGVRAACVFGSAASGRMRPDSDVDVLVVDDAADPGALGLAALEAGLVLGRDIDLKRCAPSELRAERARPGTSYLKRALAGPAEWAVGSIDEALAACEPPPGGRRIATHDNGTVMRTLFLAAALVLAPLSAGAAQEPREPTRADSLRGSITPERAWWDVVFYDLHARIDPADSSIAGRTGITYRVTGPARELQIDLQAPLRIDSVVQDGRRLRLRRDGSAYFATLAARQPVGRLKTVTVHYGGKPLVAPRAPWDGGFVWARDTLGSPWAATAVQGTGASAWWPNKDTQADEPDSQRVAITVPDPMVNVSNGRLRSVRPNGDGTTTYEWFVSSPINNYGVAVNAGRYAYYREVFRGEGGELTLDFFPLRDNLQAARRQFSQVRPVLECFERWFGPFPWYRDGFKLVETPYLGMEHQSAVAYGNGYQNGYRGRDLSGTGLGLAWDFIIVHEIGHEWFGNSITTADIADMWVHEGFTNYSEGIYTECQQGKEAGARYIVGSRRNVQNDRPVVARYGINEKGSSDMYYKAGNMLHTMRQIVDDDEKWREILRGLNRDFRHRIVTGRQVQEYINRRSGIDFDPVYRQYLTTTMIPVLEYRIEGETLRYRWANVVPGFDMPVRVTLSAGGFATLRPTTEWRTARVRLPSADAFRVDENFYVTARDVGG